MSFIMPLFMVGGLLFITTSDTNAILSEEFVIVNDSEFVEENVYPRLSENLQANFTSDSKRAFEQLEQSELAMIYEIPVNFPEEGSRIKTRSINGENNDIFFESEFTSVLSEVMTENALNEAELDFEKIQVAEPSIKQSYTPIDGNLVIVVFMTIFFMSYASSLVSADLNKLRSDGVLTRSIVTNARSWQILGSVLAAFSLNNFISAMLVILLICLIFGITITQLPVIIAAILAFCIFNAGFTMVLFRLFKNDQVILMVGIVLSIVFVFLGIGIIDIPGLSFFEYVSPFYWLFESLDTGAILPNIPVIALYGLVLFTAGSFKVERLVRS
ncbi:ABC transporter permease [Ruoffia sp. FAM 24228]